MRGCIHQKEQKREQRVRRREVGWREKSENGVQEPERKKRAKDGAAVEGHAEMLTTEVAKEHDIKHKRKMPVRNTETQRQFSKLRLQSNTMGD